MSVYDGGWSGVYAKLSEVGSCRGGCFCVSADTIKSDICFVRDLLSRVVVVRAEQRFDNGSINYSALSPLFDLITDGEEWPVYRIEVKRTKGLHSVSFTRVSDVADACNGLCYFHKVECVGCVATDNNMVYCSSSCEVCS